MNRFYWDCDLVGYSWDRAFREDCEVRIYDGAKENRVVYRITLPKVTFDESHVQSERVLDLFLLTQQENQP
jgi:hypothetical protein